ncbi:5'/3'-nucleotidase SurE [Filimonas effusa]|uniref:5'-nucleotidase SurE n=1 Tax=Filimonas effusa TaxID=2508721 RepID=A0A4Q1DBQ0_9BACT|nr:5'/3'-nucleotidase SurE [Filimonas effusa]RXK86358.1 5'/3'-nucleotidase SurE [Filimonas effusa]
MRILVTNDDGIYSPGLKCLAAVAAKFGEVVVVAPDVEQSSMGHAITATRPLSYRKSPVDFDGIPAYKVNGTPADCVALGTHLWNTTDLVLSGINMGLNLGNGMWHSGTLAAAKQAVLLGVTGIALSMPYDNTPPEFDAIVPFVEKSLEMVLENKELTLANINFPKQPRGMRWTRQSVRLYDGKIMPGTDPLGRKHYWFTVVPLEAAEEGTDRHAVENGYVSVTPLRLDLTNEAQLAKALKQQTV